MDYPTVERARDRAVDHAGTPLAAGASIDVEFALRIAQGAAFQLTLNTEAQHSTSP